MSKEKQIEQMERVIADAFYEDYNMGCDPDTNTVAEHLYNAGYRKRSEAKWLGKPIAGYATIRCSKCHTVFEHNNGKWRFCPHCGAKMKEGAG